MVAGLVFLAGFAPASRGQEVPAGSLSDREKGKMDSAARTRALEESLVLAKAEAEYFRQQWLELAARNEALGLDVLTGDQKAMHEKLVRAIGELYQSEKQKRALEDVLVRLIEAAQAFHQAPAESRVQKRAEYEVAVRAAREALEGRTGARMKVAASFRDAVVVAVDDQLGLVVVNAGRSQGMQVGMPFHLVRQDVVFGRCRILETREFLSAALVEELRHNNSVQVGDRLVLAATGK